MALSLEQRIAAFEQLGRVFGLFGRSGAWPGSSSGLTQGEFNAFEQAIARAGQRNGWFTDANVRHMLLSLSRMLEPSALEHWIAGYPELNGQRAASGRQRSVGIIMAGNVPMVGFHDLLCVVLSGHIARIKLSSQDDELIPAALDLLEHFAPGIREQAMIEKGKLKEMDAVIATGSNNTSRYFEHYFGHLPRIVRKGRVSVAVLDGSETEGELAALGEDVFRYFGLGCRNVSKLYVPRDFAFDRFFQAIYSEWKEIINHNKYANNYDYNRTVWLLEKVPIIENGFLMLKEDKALASPVASLHYERYDDSALMLKELTARREEVQCIVGHGHVLFGMSQFPSVGDYADDVDTMKFLIGLTQGTTS